MLLARPFNLNNSGAIIIESFHYNSVLFQLRNLHETNNFNILEQELFIFKINVFYQKTSQHLSSFNNNSSQEFLSHDSLIHSLLCFVLRKHTIFSGVHATFINKCKISFIEANSTSLLLIH